MKIKNEIYSLGLKTIEKKSEKKNTFSIIIPFFNTHAYILNLCNSILNQNYDLKNIEIILVDDGSEKSPDYLYKYFKKKVSFHLVKTKNYGPAVARNHGLEIVSNDFVCFLDSDDTISSNYISRINECVNAYPNSSLFICNLVLYYEKEKKTVDGHYLSYRFSERKKHYEVDLLKRPLFFQMHMSSACFRVRDIKENNIKIRNIKPQFEDTFFINEFILHTGCSQVISNFFCILYADSAFG